MTETHKTPAHNFEAERAVIGSILINPAALPAARLRLGPADFYAEVHRTIFAALLQLHADGFEAVDSLVLSDRLRKDGRLAEIGGATYLYDCIHSVVTADNVDYYVGLVREASLDRQVERQLYATTQDKTPENVGRLGDLILQLQGNRPGRIFDFRQDVQGVVNRLLLEKEPPVIRTGFFQLDSTIVGFERGELVTIGARTSGGKTAMMTRIMCNMAMDGYECLYFSTEMSREQMVMRVLPMATGIPFYKFRSRDLDPRQRELVSRTAAEKLSLLPIKIVDKSRISIEDVRGCTVQAAPDIVFVDYLQRCELPKAENRAYEIEGFMVSLKAFTKDLGIRSVIAVQLDRGMDRNPNTAPVLADLRGSGSIEHESDIVLLGWKPPEAALQKNPNFVPPSPGCVAMEWIIAKGRNVAAGARVDFELNGELIRMAERASEAGVPEWVEQGG